MTPNDRAPKLGRVTLLCPGFLGRKVVVVEDAYLREEMLTSARKLEQIILSKKVRRER